MSHITRLIESTDQIWAQIEDRRRPWFVASLAAIAGVTLLAIITGPSRIIGPWDVLTLLAGAWRMFNGQTPHTDFYSPLGVLWIWAPSVAMQIVGPSLAAVHYAHVFFAVAISSAGAFFFFRKLPGFQAFLMTVFLVLLLFATRPLGGSPDLSTYAMSYNRVGWALSSILMIVLFLDPRSGAKGTARLDMAAVGVLLGLMFYCKVTYFLAGVGALALASIFSKELRREWLAATLGWLGVLAAVLIFTGVNPLAYLNDLAFAAKSQSVALRAHIMHSSLIKNAPQLALGLALWAGLAAWPFIDRRMSVAAVLKTSLVIGMVACSGIAITVGNSFEGNDVPLFLVAGILLLELSRSAAPTAGARKLSVIATRLSALVLVTGIFFLGVARNDALSLATSFSARHGASAPAEQGQRFDSVTLRNFWIPSTADHLTAYSQAREVPARINDGLALLRANTKGPMRLAVLANSDAFSFALGWPPIKGGALWFGNNYSFSEAQYLPPDEVLSGANLVIYPILRSDDVGYDADSVDLLLRLYGSYLDQHFIEAARSRYWILLRSR